MQNTDEEMRPEYSFKNGKRGAIVPEPSLETGKSRITIRLDTAVLQRFYAMADETGGAVGYQTLINKALAEYIAKPKANADEQLMRKVVREELRRSQKRLLDSGKRRTQASQSS